MTQRSKNHPTMRKPVKKKTAAKPSKKASKKTSKKTSKKASKKASKDPIESAIDSFVDALVKSGAAKMLSKEESDAFFANHTFQGCIAIPKDALPPA